MTVAGRGRGAVALDIQGVDLAAWIAWRFQLMTVAAVVFDT